MPQTVSECILCRYKYKCETRECKCKYTFLTLSVSSLSDVP